MRRVIRPALYVVLVALLISAFYVGQKAYRIYNGLQKIHKVVPRTTEEPVVTIPPLDGTKRINFLVLGSDTDAKKEEARPLAQSMIVVTVDPQHHKVGLLSIPRDFYVPVRGHGMQKIDLAYKYGGVALARETVERLFHIPIHHYAWVGLQGFTNVINTFGGVTVDVSHPILDDYYPADMNSAHPYNNERIFLPAGWQHLDGERALQYVRSRHGDRIGDFSRSARQQQVLLQLQQHVNALNVLLNLDALVADLQDSVLTDLGIDELYQLAQLARHVHHSDITQVVLQAPYYSSFGWTRDGQSIVVPNWSRINPLIARMFAPIGAAAPTQQRRGGSPHPSPRPTPRPTTTASTTTPRPAPKPTVAATATPPPTPSPTPIPGPSSPVLVIHHGTIVRVSANGDSQTLGVLPGASMPALSPDRQRLALIQFTPNYSDLCVLDLKTHRLHRLLHNASAVLSSNLWAAYPTWSADGHTLYFSWDRAKLQLPASEARPVDLTIWSIPASGGTANPITQPQRAANGTVELGDGGDQEATVRPHSKLLAFVHWDYLTNNQPYSQLELRNLSTGAQWALTPPGGRVLQPSWSSDGRLLTYIRRGPNGQDQIVVAPVARSGNGYALGRRTPIAVGQVAQPAFAPSGKWVSYLLAQGGGFSLQTESVAGGTPSSFDAAGSGLDASIKPIWLP